MNIWQIAGLLGKGAGQSPTGLMALGQDALQQYQTIPSWSEQASVQVNDPRNPMDRLRDPATRARDIDFVMRMIGPTKLATESSVPRIASTPAMQEALLRNSWKRHGMSMDYEDIPGWEKIWEREAIAWNKTHPPREQVPPKGDYQFGAVPEFEQLFDQKYLANKKSPFPGVNDANQFFEDNGMRGHATYLHPDEVPY